MDEATIRMFIAAILLSGRINQGGSSEERYAVDAAIDLAEEIMRASLRYQEGVA